jgi:CheY-like chemotaxis protein
VEDNIVNQKVICRILSQRGYQVQVANNGAEALEMFKSPHQFDVILMDVQMPVMDGLTATIKIREMERDASEEHIPIIGLTAGAMQEDKEKCLAAGMSHYLPKPVSRECLFAALRRWTKGRRRRPDADDQSEDGEGEPTPPPPLRQATRTEKRRDTSN